MAENVRSRGSDRLGTLPLASHIERLRPKPRTKDNRKSSRIQLKGAKACLQTPVRGTDVAVVVDISRGGLRFVSSKRYEPGDWLRVAAPYTEGAPTSLSRLKSCESRNALPRACRASTLSCSVPHSLETGSWDSAAGPFPQFCSPTACLSGRMLVVHNHHLSFLWPAKVKPIIRQKAKNSV